MSTRKIQFVKRNFTSNNEALTYSLNNPGYVVFDEKTHRIFVNGARYGSKVKDVKFYEVTEDNLTTLITKYQSTLTGTMAAGTRFVVVEYIEGNDSIFQLPSKSATVSSTDNGVTVSVTTSNGDVTDVTVTNASNPLTDLNIVDVDYVDITATTITEAEKNAAGAKEVKFTHLEQADGELGLNSTTESLKFDKVAFTGRAADVSYDNIHSQDDSWDYIIAALNFDTTYYNVPAESGLNDGLTYHSILGLTTEEYNNLKSKIGTVYAPIHPTDVNSAIDLLVYYDRFRYWYNKLEARNIMLEMFQDEYDARISGLYLSEEPTVTVSNTDGTITITPKNITQENGQVTLTDGTEVSFDLGDTFDEKVQDLDVTDFSVVEVTGTNDKTLTYYKVGETDGLVHRTADNSLTFKQVAFTGRLENLTSNFSEIAPIVTEAKSLINSTTDHTLLGFTDAADLTALKTLASSITDPTAANAEDVIEVLIAASRIREQTISDNYQAKFTDGSATPVTVSKDTTDPNKVTVSITTKSVEQTDGTIGDGIASTPVTFDINKYTLTKTAGTVSTSYLNRYQLYEAGTAVGDPIDIPKDMLVKKAEVISVTSSNISNINGALGANTVAVGDKVIDMQIYAYDADASTSGNQDGDLVDHIYIPVKTLLGRLEAGLAIAIDGDTINVDPTKFVTDESNNVTINFTKVTDEDGNEYVKVTNTLEWTEWDNINASVVSEDMI